jgi:hypothetical protein
VETIGATELWSFLDSASYSRTVKCGAVRKNAGCPVSSFLDLATKIAELQFKNLDYVFLFRGQGADYRNSKGNTSLKPTLFRSGQNAHKVPSPAKLTRRFEILNQAERELLRHYIQQNLVGLDRMKRQRIVRWSLLQHYEVCKTPLLDVTQSLRIAASFASRGSPERAFIFVLGVPNLSGAVTASAEAGIQIIRLSSVCPPSAIRPHIQEGYLVGEYPEMADFAQKENYGHYEIDFGRRLIAKFYFDPQTFWKQDTFPIVPEEALYPNASDPIYTLTQQIKESLDLAED